MRRIKIIHPKSKGILKSNIMDNLEIQNVIWKGLYSAVYEAIY